MKNKQVYVAVFLMGGVIDHVKLGDELDKLIEYCKENYKDGFDPDYNDCWIMEDGTNNCYFNYANYYMENNAVC
jgi:hypothetical protein